VAVLLIRPRRFADERGWFTESWHRERFRALGVAVDFCQDNHSCSRRLATLRGLHFQAPPHAQAKLVRCTRGKIFDVAVDLRRASPTFGRWVGAELGAADGNQLFIPAGFAHGFVTLEDDSEVEYKVDAFYAPEADAGIAWDDPDIAIDWPLAGPPILSDKDRALPRLAELAIDFPYDGEPLRPLGEARAP
jgi:dTDP-4-dehydrorhamnose 3,5-epimerase